MNRVRPRKSAEIKIRVEPLTRNALEQLATLRQLDLSDIVRQALREHLTRENRVQA